MNIGNYFKSITTKKIFGCKDNEEVYKCLSRWIDVFDQVLNNNLPIWKVVNKCDKKSELTSSQIVTTMQRIIFLKQAYLAVLNLDSCEKIHVKDCCEKAVKKCIEFGLKKINSPKILMKLNRYYRENKTFPHPNLVVELDCNYSSPFLDSFPEFRIRLRKWATQNLAKMNCVKVRNVINEVLIPEIYQTYQNNDEHNNLPSYEEFLEEFSLSKNGVSSSTTLRWLHALGFEYKERKKSHFTDKHESEENVSYREEFVKKYFEAEFNTYRWVHLKEDVAKSEEREWIDWGIL